MKTDTSRVVSENYDLREEIKEASEEREHFIQMLGEAEEACKSLKVELKRRLPDEKDLIQKIIDLKRGVEVWKSMI